MAGVAGTAIYRLAGLDDLVIFEFNNPFVVRVFFPKNSTEIVGIIFNRGIPYSKLKQILNMSSAVQSEKGGIANVTFTLHPED